MRSLFSEKQEALTNRLNEFSKTAHSAQQIAREKFRMHQEIEMHERIIQKEDRKHQEALDVQKELLQITQRQAHNAESSALTSKIFAWLSGGEALISIIRSLIGFFHRK